MRGCGGTELAWTIMSYRKNNGEKYSQDWNSHVEYRHPEWSQDQHDLVASYVLTAFLQQSSFKFLEDMLYQQKRTEISGVTTTVQDWNSDMPV